MRNKLSREEKLFIRDFGIRLKELRTSRNWSQSKLEAIAGLSRNQVWRMENGEVNTTISNLLLLSQAFGIDVKDLLEFHN